MQPLDIIIVDKSGSLKLVNVKEFKPEDLFKKCGFKKDTDFTKQVEWKIKHEKKTYNVQVFAKTDGRANSENKYDFPPPIDTRLLFGSCAIVTQVRGEDGSYVYVNATIPLWQTFYEKLFGGFEDLSSTAKEDEEEEDELDAIPKDKKTKYGYLKDGFVVDSSDTEDNTHSSDLSDTEYESTKEEDEEEEDEGENDLSLEDIGSELSEEEYDYTK